MKLPFTLDQFFEVFERYNQSVWPVQIVLNMLAIAVIFLVFRPGKSTSRMIAGILSFLWAWMAVAYQFTFFAAINPAAWLFGAFFLAGALWFAWIGVATGKLQFAAQGDTRAWFGGLLVAFSLLVYPLLGYLFGHRYPAVPTFGLPCPTTIFTIGILLFAVAPYPRSAFAVPVLWSAIGSAAAFQLGVPQDYGLLAAGLIALAVAIGPQRTANHGVPGTPAGAGAPGA